MVSLPIIKKKINAVQHHLARIHSRRPASLDEFLNDDDLKDIITHNLFVMLQNVIDIGTHLIADAGWAEPDYLAEIPEILRQEKVIPEGLTGPLKAMIGLRNLIAHEYGVLDYRIIYRIVSEDLGDIQCFLKAIIEYCRL